MKTAIAYPERVNRSIGGPFGLNKAGLPSSATGHIESDLDLNKHIVRRSASTYFTSVEGDECAHLGIHAGDLLVVDRSLAPRHDSLVLAVLEGELHVCRLVGKMMEWYLVKGNGNRQKMDFEDRDMIIWGRVTHVIQSV